MRLDSLKQLIEDVVDSKVAKWKMFDDSMKSMGTNPLEFSVKSLWSEMNYLKRKLDEKQIDFGGWDKYTDSLNERVTKIEEALGYCPDCQEFDGYGELQENMKDTFEDIYEKLNKVEELTNADSFEYQEVLTLKEDGKKK